MLLDFALNSSINWRELNIINDTLVLEQGNIINDITVDSGTGAGQLNHTFVTVTGISGNNRFDMLSLKRNIFGNIFTVNLDNYNVKIFYVKNASPNNMLLCGTGDNGVTNVFGLSYLGQYIYPSGHYISYNLVSGFNVNTGERYFYISGNGNCELGIFSVG